MEKSLPTFHHVYRRQQKREKKTFLAEESQEVAERVINVTVMGSKKTPI